MVEIGNILMVIIPSYISNSFPVLVGGGAPLDFDIKIDGKRLLGKNKTIRGFIGGISLGIIVAYLLSIILNYQNYFFVGVLSSIGAMVGDSVGSFIKRRFGVKEGDPFFLDSTLFVIFSIAFVLAFYPNFIGIGEILIIILLTHFIHIIFNKLAYVLKWKNVPW